MNTESELEQILKFLLGEKPYRGVWFGDKVNGEAFWWRRHLRRALAEHHQQLEAKVAEARKNIVYDALAVRAWEGFDCRTKETKRLRDQIWKLFKKS